MPAYFSGWVVCQQCGQLCHATSRMGYENPMDHLVREHLDLSERLEAVAPTDERVPEAGQKPEPAGPGGDA